MEVNPKYKINDVVFFMQDNQVKRGYVYCFKIHVGTYWDMQTHNFKEGDRLVINYHYKICTDNYSKSGSEYIHENYLFDTKKALLESL